MDLTYGSQSSVMRARFDSRMIPESCETCLFLNTVKVVQNWWITKHDLIQPQFGAISQDHPLRAAQQKGVGRDLLLPQIPYTRSFKYTVIPQAYTTSTKCETVLVDMSGAGG
jgi:hypothetical protein